MEELARACDDLASDWLHVRELGREAMKCEGGPSLEEVERAIDAGFAWHDIAEDIRRRG